MVGLRGLHPTDRCMRTLTRLPLNVTRIVYVRYITSLGEVFASLGSVERDGRMLGFSEGERCDRSECHKCTSLRSTDVKKE